jgi:arabinan endo-1,5-alpha-L-arabinosidase
MPRRTALALTGLLGAALVGGVPGTAASVPRSSAGTPYTNPVSRPFADTYADPSVIRGKDGWWYAYGTTDPLREGEGERHLLPISRSRDLAHWEYVGDAFTESSLPSWAAADAALWAPDIRYVDGQYRLYYVVTQTTATSERDDNAVGVATAPTPAGPWTDAGAPVVGPRRGDSGRPGDFTWTFDPSVVTDVDGSQWLFYGSYYGGIFVTRLDAAGKRAVGAPTREATDNKFEGAYVVRRGGWWYLFASTANCCAGPTTGYSVQVGRSRDLRGPYLDREGVPLTASRAGGTPVLTQNGNRWVGAGHNAVATDSGGQDWIVYHAVDRADPYLDGTDGINQRPMLLDRLDWIGGWPSVRAGRGPSDGPQPGPVTDGPAATRFDDGIGPPWRAAGSWTTPTEHDAGRFARSGNAGSAIVAPVETPGAVRVEADLRGAAGLAVGLPGSRPRVLMTVDPSAGELKVQALGDRGAQVAKAPLPAGYDAAAWHAAVLQIRDGRLHAELSHARLGDPLAVVDTALPAGAGSAGEAGAYAVQAGADVDNLSALTPTEPVTAAAPDPAPGVLDPAASDEFDGSAPDAGWQWVRPDPKAQVTGGALRWPTQAADLVGPGNDASVLLRRPPAGDWTVETKVSIDLGTDTVRNFQQAGLVAYVGDDLFTRLSHVAIWNTRQTEFGKEMPYAGRLQYGGTIVGPPAETTWLRITHRTDPDNGEHELRAWSSRDGATWEKGGVWTLPAGSDVRVGLVSHGGAGATAAFDYLRTYRP